MDPFRSASIDWSSGEIDLHSIVCCACTNTRQPNRILINRLLLFILFAVFFSYFDIAIRCVTVFRRAAFAQCTIDNLLYENNIVLRLFTSDEGLTVGCKKI